MSDPGYLHGHAEPVLRSHRWRSVENSAAYLLPELEPGMALLDVGCGPGTITADFAARVPGLSVIGVDASAEVVAAAAASFPEVGFVVGDLFALPFEDVGFDVVHLHQVLQHLREPVAALESLSRLLKPGGLLAARDATYADMRWSPASAGLDRWLELYEACGRALGAEPDAGLHLASWAEEAGFGAIRSSTSEWRFETAEERSWWGSLWAERVTGSQLATTALEHGLSTPAELDELAEAWRAFGAAAEGSFVVPHGEILCRRSGVPASHGRA